MRGGGGAVEPAPGGGGAPSPRRRGPAYDGGMTTPARGAVTYDGATTIGFHLLPDVAPLYARLGHRFASIGDRGTNKGLEAARAGGAPTR